MCWCLSRIIFRIFPNFDISWYMRKDFEIHLKNCVLIDTCSTSWIILSLVSLVDRVLASDIGRPWATSWLVPYFFFSQKTSEYSEIYCKQLTSEHFLPYNYRSSTLPGISRNIGWLLRQCVVIIEWHPKNRFWEKSEQWPETRRWTQPSENHCYYIPLVYPLSVYSVFNI
jgi:hypothetical protein